MGTSPKLTFEDYRPPAWKEPVVPIQSTQLRKADGKVLNIEDMVQLFISNGNLRILIWFGIVENLGVGVLLGTSFIERCIYSIFLNEQKVVIWHSSTVEII